MRCFVAVLLSAETRRQLAEAARPLCGPAREFRSIPASNLHVTLQFLGEVEEPLLTSVQDVLPKAFEGCRPFVLEFGSSGAFPNPRRPRILWIGARRGVEELEDLASRVGTSLRPLGLHPDKSFKAHVTIARSRDRVRTITPYTSQNITPIRDRIDTVHLVRSELPSAGARYTSVLSVPLDSPQK